MTFIKSSLDESGAFGFGKGGEREVDERDGRDRARPELRPTVEERREKERRIPEPRVQVRKVRYEFFEAGSFKSTATVVGEPGDDSLEGQLERWRTAKLVNGVVTLPDGSADATLRTAAEEKQFHDYEYRFEGGTHYLFVRYTE